MGKRHFIAISKRAERASNNQRRKHQLRTNRITRRQQNLTKPQDQDHWPADVRLTISDLMDK